MSSVSLAPRKTLGTRRGGSPAVAISSHLASSEVAAVIRKTDEDFGHSGPFAKVSVLTGIMKKGGTNDMIQWLVMSINDLYRNDMISIGELSWESLTGYRAPGNKGVADLLIYKKDFLTYFLEVFAAKHPFDPAFVSKLRETLKDDSNAGGQAGRCAKSVCACVCACVHVFVCLC
jgi:hypothetical protein